MSRRGLRKVVDSCGRRYEYQWMDGVQVKKPLQGGAVGVVSFALNIPPVTAPQYVEYLMTWVQSCLDNDKLFPARVDVPFPKHFESVVKQIFKRLFRVYAHIYYSHFQKIVALGESGCRALALVLTSVLSRRRGSPSQHVLQALLLLCS